MMPPFPQFLSENLTRLWLHDIDPSFYCDVIECVRKRRLPRLKELGVSTWTKSDKTDPKRPPNNLIGVDLMSFSIFQWIQGTEFPDIESLAFNRFIRSMEMLCHFSWTPVLTNLRKLDISHSSNISGCLSLLMCHRFASLEILILSNCGLSNTDLFNLAQASLRGRLPELKHLDISNNNKLNNVSESFFYTAKWQKLSCLIIVRLDEVSDVFNQPCDCLENLEEIHFLVSGEGIFDGTGWVQWQRLTDLKMTCSVNEFLKTLTGITYNVECDMLPSLQNLCMELEITVENKRSDAERLKDLWKMLKKKLRPSICKHIVDSFGQFTSCALNNRCIQNEYL